MPSLRRNVGFTFVWFLLATAAFAQKPELGAGLAAKKPLDHTDYDIWTRIAGQQLAADGTRLLYGLASEAKDPRLVIQPLPNGQARELERAEGGQFSYDGRFVVFRIKPGKDTLKVLREKRTPNNRLPTDSMGVIDLQSGQIVLRVQRIRNFRMPERASGWLAYQVNDSAQAGGGEGGGRRGGGGGGGQRGGGQRGGAQAGEGGGQGGQQNAQQRRKDEGYALFVRNLATGQEQKIENTTSYEFTRDGARLVYFVSHRDGTGDGAYSRDLATGQTTTLLAGKGNYRALSFDETGAQLAFLANKDDYEAKQPAYTLYHWDAKTPAARAVAAVGNAAIPAGWWVSENGTPSFSRNGQRLFFGTSPRPEPEPDSAQQPLADERVGVDVWAWTDQVLQPQQLRQVDQERRRTYQAFVSLKDGKITQLATQDMPDITLVQRGDADIMLGRSNLPYRLQGSWGEGGSDYYLLDLRTGAKEKLFTNLDGNVAVSPEGKYLTWFDSEKKAWFAMDPKLRTAVNISEKIPHPVHNELHDSPSLPGSYGNGGWTNGDAQVLIYDNHDIWAVDPTGKAAPRNVTEGVGRKENLRFRIVNLDPDARAVDPTKDILLSTSNLWTKTEGFYRDRVQGDAAPTRLVMDNLSFGNPTKARNADVLLLTRSTFRNFPDLYVTNANFSNFQRVSDANPQQKDYRWGDSELVEWRSAHGEPLQGVLYKPEGFDPSKKYPMMVYFYERLSNNLHNYVAPTAGTSVNISFYVSRGYLVFTPDIPYREGYPGESAHAAIVPGVLSLIEKGFVDAKKVGMQGHSWGGYQVSYLVTRTNLFAAAEAGAPVANMVSAYGGIRWSSGLVRQFQYEKTQSRIGGSLWERPMQFIENSPIFWADKVETPLLILHNDQDGAVPWYQGIEYFVALRRLGKPAWMVNYNGEDHGVARAPNRKDWATRMQQFFDHYLQDAPPPQWMVDGVPAIKKGTDGGLKLVTDPPKKVTTEPQPNGGKN